MTESIPEELIVRLRHEVQSYLAALTPAEARALRTRFGLHKSPIEEHDEEMLRALIRELAALRKKRE